MFRMPWRRIWTAVDDRWLCRKPNAHFLHVSKTGGTAIRHAIDPWRTAGRYRVLLHPHEVSVADVPAGEPFFLFLRDPASRFVSAFYSRQRQGRPRYDSPWRPEEAEAFARFATPDALARAIGTPEGDAAMRGIGLLRDHYGSWLVDRSTMQARRGDLLMVGFQETLEADFARVRELLGLPGAAALPGDHVQAHRNPGRLDRSLSPEAQARLRDWYREDYDWVAWIREGHPREPA